MADVRRNRHLIRLLGLVVLGAFLLGAAPCAFAHAGDHHETEATCLCIGICCGDPLPIAEPAVARAMMPPPRPHSLLSAVSPHTPRDIYSAIFQPPKA